eukprot:194261-Amphidinium_carterae.2
MPRKSGRRTTPNCLEESSGDKVEASLQLQVDPEDTEVTYLNRVIQNVRGSSPRVEIEHDMRHLDYLMRDLGLDGIKVKALDCPSVKIGMQEVQRRTDESTLEPADCTRCRSGVMRVAYLSLDRPDLAHA